MWRRLLIPILLVSAVAAQSSAAPKAAADYVGMGSSYASAPGVDRRALGSPVQCLQSDANYAHLFAAQRHLSLNDQSCSGATTDSILASWRGLPAQINAVGPVTQLVTITVGGNDVDFVGDLYAWSCQNVGARRGLKPQRACAQPILPINAAWTQLARNFQTIVAGIHQRSPRAKIVFIDYPTLLPAHGACPARLPLTPGELDTARTIATRLAAVTRQAASDSGSVLVAAGALTAGHDLCSADPWMTGLITPASATGFKAIPYHPTAASMRAIAAALDRVLPR